MKRLKMIRHNITYTIWNEVYKAHMENNALIYRAKLLTSIGAQRIIRRDHPGAIVTRIETAIIG